MPITTCPSCEIAMEVQHFEDVLFDVCPSCRGIWLDRGEMQKIIANVRRQEAEAPSADFSDPRRVGREHERRREPETYRDEREGPRKRRKRGFWDVIEDIID